MTESPGSSAEESRESAQPAMPLLRMDDIGISFGGVPVLRDACLEVGSGEVHVLAGENGAGKSTLIKILGGVHAGYEGTIRLHGESVRFRSPGQAAARGIALIHQEMSLVPAMSVLDNLFLAPAGRSGAEWLDRRPLRSRGREALDLLGLEVPLDTPVEDLPLSVRQLIEVAKALAASAEIIVMDEPTSALTDPEVERLFGLIASLKARGCGIVYITHRMEEIYRIADRITVLRDGRYIGTARASELPGPELVRRMVGRALNQQFPPRTAAPGEERIRVEGFCVPDPEGAHRWAAKNVSFAVRAGEILGIAGLQGSGKSELLHGIFGSYGPVVRGQVWLNDRVWAVRSPGASIRHGLALLTNDRKGTGLVPGMDIPRNITLASLRTVARAGVLRPSAELEAAERHSRSLGIRAASLEQEVATLSGGNQQKVVFGKWLQAEPAVFMLDEPTRGVDVGAKHEIYTLLNELTAKGIAILLITSEMPELLAMSDRILVMHRGEVTACLQREDFNAEHILHAAMGERTV